MESMFEEDSTGITEIDLISDKDESHSNQNESIKNSSLKKKDVKKDDVNKGKSKENTDFVRFTFDLSKETYRQFSLLCSLKEISKCDFIRDCIDKGIKECFEDPMLKKIFEIKFGKK